MAAVACSFSFPFFSADDDDLYIARERTFVPKPLASPLSKPRFSRNLPVDIMKDLKVERIDSMTNFIREKISSGEEDESFYVIDLGALIQQHEQWVRLLPRVQPFYAVKCNPNLAFLRTLASLGAGFDCASKEEIRLARECNVPPSKIIYANPCKSPAHIVKARQEGIKKMTFDNVDELRKIHSIFPEAELVLRILPDDSHSLMKFGSKFGAPPSTWDELFAEARKLKLKLIGVSFHVGSGCFDAVAYEHALQLSREAFDLAKLYGYEFTLLDIGGGYPGSNDSLVHLKFPQIADVVRPLLDQLFPRSVQVISEPGRYYASSTTTFVTSIHSRRSVVEDDGKAFKYYICDGVYGGFNCLIFDHANPEPIVVHPKDNEARYKSTIFGPTCDSMDRVVNEVMLPELQIGDWLMFENMGAYTTAASSAFNGFEQSRAFFVLSTLPPPVDTSLS